MRVMVLVKATDDSEKGFLPTPEAMQAMEAMGRFNDELRNAGIMRTADGLKLVPIKPAPDRKSRRALLEAARISGPSKAKVGPSAARSQDFLYGDDG